MAKMQLLRLNLGLQSMIKELITEKAQIRKAALAALAESVEV